MFLHKWYIKQNYIILYQDFFYDWHYWLKQSNSSVSFEWIANGKTYHTKIRLQNPDPYNGLSKNSDMFCHLGTSESMFCEGIRVRVTYFEGGATFFEKKHEYV